MADPSVKESSRSLLETCRRLSEASEKSFLNPYTYIDWPEQMDLNQWFMSPELISIYGTQSYEALADEQKRKLSFFEAVNFFSLNIHGEKSLVEGLAKRLYAGELKDYAEYLHHFLDEENKHMIYFGGFSQRYAGKIYRDRKMSFAREYEAGEENFLFFAKVMIFEEIVDVYNLRMSKDERLEPTARKINLIHHLEEARHLVFGRQMVQHLFDTYKSKWQAQTLEQCRQYLGSYISATWKEYYNPDVYKDSGSLSGAYELAEAAYESEIARRHRREVSGKLTSFLLEQEILIEEPAF